MDSVGHQVSVRAFLFVLRRTRSSAEIHVRLYVHCHLKRKVGCVHAAFAWEGAHPFPALGHIDKIRRVVGCRDIASVKFADASVLWRDN